MDVLNRQIVVNSTVGTESSELIRGNVRASWRIYKKSHAGSRLYEFLCVPYSSVYMR